jgi:phage repressor protein C with HTH and peptisase S24 domain
MQLKHADIWRAVDRLAERHKLSASGLAKKAGLSPTVFNPSKRSTRQRKRWPSTESIACILQATGTDVEDFIALAGANESEAPRRTLPLLNLAPPSRKGAFDETGKPIGNGWDEINFPALHDARAFALEISGKAGAPLYREGDRIVVSPTEKPRRGDRVVVRTKKGDVMLRELGLLSARAAELAPLAGGGEAVNIPFEEIEWIYRIVWVSQ